MSPLTFLDLPGEIRNQIYYLLLVIPRLPSSRVYLLDRDPPIYPQILSVCRKVHDEAEQILYGSNVFVAELNFLVGLPRLRWEYPTIKSSRLISIINKYFIAVSSLDSPAFTCVEIKDAFSGMEELTIWAVRPYLLSRYFMLRYFEGVRGVKKAKIGWVCA
ncbi:hypothetical protein EYC84_007912 [Monilinia fructicola]|uniref:F-box domain-containing protein n=1 Tax=Monilinia fructicola TaxID=38448 RepID=A0A5M9JME6_MONFR|nr:hypothetical protein EYC84_007912 [Monilinia fructicola]